MKPGTSKVFIVDDDEAVLTALKRLLAGEGFVVETFSSASAFLEREPHDGPYCLVLDQRMPGVTGLELQRRILETDGALSVVFLTGHGDVPTSVAAMKAGAVDFLIKPVDGDLLIDAVRRALMRSDDALQARRERDEFLARLVLLTPRERQVGTLVLQGLLNKQIAWELGTALKTVKTHRARMMQKLAVGSVAELARLAERTNTLTPTESPTPGGAATPPQDTPDARWNQGRI
jgi:FixJ family two-component response regulator